MPAESKQQIPVSHTKGTELKEAAQELQELIPRSLAEYENFMERMMTRPWFAPFAWNESLWGNLVEPLKMRMPGMRMPSIDVVDRDEDVLIRAEVPGIEKKDLKVSLTDSTLSIAGASSRERNEEQGRFHRQEISSSSFSRSIPLPGGVNYDKVSATLKDGVLEVVVPKVEAARRRNVDIQ